jgi:hypothetical protein
MREEVNIGLYDAEDIAKHILGINDNDDSLIDDMLIEKWNIDIDTFREISEKLFNMVDLSVNPLSGIPTIGFTSGNFWFVKKEIDQRFINCVVQWMTDGGEISEKGKGFSRIIEKNGEPEYEIKIIKC